MVSPTTSPKPAGVSRPPLHRSTCTENPFPESSAVQGYLKTLGKEYSGKYNASGRAYPDVAAQGVSVEIILGGSGTPVDGTSCSSPIFASVIGLLNDELLTAGKPVLGFLNPWLYANPGAFNDITSGKPSFGRALSKSLIRFF